MRALVDFGWPLAQAASVAIIKITRHRRGSSGETNVMRGLVERYMGSLLFSLCPGDGLQAFELFFVGAGEFIAKQLAEIAFWIFDHIMEFVAIEFPVAQPRRRRQQRTFLELTIERFLQALR